MNPNKIQPSTARVVVKSGFFYDTVIIEAQFGNGKIVELAEISPQLSREHARILADHIVEAIRKM